MSAPAAGTPPGSERSSSGRWRGLGPLVTLSHARRAAVALSWCAAVTVAALAVVVVAASDEGVVAGELLRDPMAVLDAPFWVGAVSNLGVVLWAGSAVLWAFLAAVAPTRARARGERSFLVAASALSTWLLLDDALLVHEQVLPLYLGLAGELAFVVTAVATALFVAVFHRRILRSDWLVLAAALGLLVASLTVDQLHDRHLLGRLGLPATGAGQLLLEDGLKLAGITAWMAYAWRTGMQAVLPTAGARGTDGPDRSEPTAIDPGVTAIDLTAPGDARLDSGRP